MKKAWVIEEMLKKMDARWEKKNINTEEGIRMYRRLNSELRTAWTCTATE